MEHISVEGRRVRLRLSLLEIVRRHVVDFNLSPIAGLDDTRTVVGRLNSEDFVAPHHGDGSGPWPRVAR